MKIAIINGPNLNLLGKREPDTYGDIAFTDYFKQLEEKFSLEELVYVQSNTEGKIVDFLHEFGEQSDGIILNAGAYTHTSLAIADAVRAIKTPVIEVHISNVYAREKFRQYSIIAPYCFGNISGFGLLSYDLAIEAFLLK
jgi:3-dehydroquinate dehydratase-2